MGVPPIEATVEGARVPRVEGTVEGAPNGVLKDTATHNAGSKLKSKHEGFSRVSRVCLTQPVRVNVLRDSATIALA